MASLTQWSLFEHTLGDGEGQGSRGCCSPWDRKELDTTEKLNYKAVSFVIFMMTEFCQVDLTVLWLIKKTGMGHTKCLYFFRLFFSGDRGARNTFLIDH